MNKAQMTAIYTRMGVAEINSNVEYVLAYSLLNPCDPASAPFHVPGKLASLSPRPLARDCRTASEHEADQWIAKRRAIKPARRGSRRYRLFTRLYGQELTAV